MLSPRFVAVCGFALLAAATAYPADRSVIPPPIISMTDDDIGFPWMSISPFSLFAPLWKLIPSFADIGPRIYTDDDKFQVVVNVKDYRKEDLKVKVKGDLIFVQGSQEANNNNKDVFATQFYHTYSLPSNSSSLLVTAKLTADGFLVVTAPIAENIDNSKDTDREVPIVETGAPYHREVSVKPVQKPTPTEAAATTIAEITTIQTQSTTQEPTTAQTLTTTQTPTTSPAPTESEAPITNPQPTISQTPTTTVSPTPVVEEEANDPTTPAQQEDATEKDNVIPHGNEVTA